MKFKFYIALFLSVFSMCCYGNQPFSYNDSLNELQSLEFVEAFETAIPDIEQMVLFIDSLDKLDIKHPHYYGIGIDSELNISNVGSWDTLNNGDRVWRLKVICPNAFTINLYFEKFQLAQNSSISFYNERNESLLGPYNSDINREDGLFSTHLIYGDTVIIELYEPQNELEQNILTINKIVYGYSNSVDDDFLIKEAKVQSDACLVDANCEEGDDYCREKYSVARIISSYNYENFYLCTGVLINNTSEDYKPFLLTAFHCVDDYTNSLAQSEKDKTQIWNIQFGYIRENCTSGSSLQTFEYFGANFRSAWDRNYTDFALVELMVQPKSGETNFPDVFYSGWDRTGNIPNNVGTLHHPAIPYPNLDSYFMKINLDSDQPSTYSTYMWSVDIWDVGSTGPGSSGAPLYNEDKKIVGQVSGQKDYLDDDIQSMCDPYKETTYGKLSLSWEGGGTSDTRLKDWLDPINSGVTTLDGIKMPNLQYGWIFPNSSVTHYAAYTDMQIGSNSTSSYKVESGAVLSLKAGREIKISPCTQIRAGSEFHAYIENPDCDDIAPLSDKLTDHNPNICSTYPKIVKEDKDFNSAYTGNTMLKVSPNPVTSISDISLTIGSSYNVSLMLYDNLGNQRYSYLDNISLKSGTYNYKLDGNDLNSGMFVLVLKIDGIIVTEKVINLK